jgi:hypothetical protein
MRKALPYWGASLSAIAMALSVPALAQNPEPFKDLDPHHWAYDAVNDLQQKGILLGYPNGYFQGKRTLTRYEFAVALERLLNKIPAGPPGPAGPAGEVGPAGPAGPPGITPEEIAELRRLMDEFRNELTALGTDVRAMRARLDQLAADVADINRRLDRMPVISGDFFQGFSSTRSRFGIVDYSGAIRGASNSLFENFSSPNDFHLGVLAKLPEGMTLNADVVTSNYLTYRGGSLTGVPTAAPNGGGQITTLYQAALNIPIGSFGSNTVLTVGRYKNQVTPLTFWRPDYDAYFDLPWYDDGNYVQDGFKLQSKFGSATTSLWAASHNGATGNFAGSAFNQPLIGAIVGPRSFPPFAAAGSPFAASTIALAPFGISNQGQIFATQSAGLHVGVPLFKWGELGLTLIDLSSGCSHFDASGTAIAVPYNNLVVYGANLTLKNLGKIKFNAEAAKSVTQKGIDTSDGTNNDESAAYVVNLGYGSGPLDVQAGYQYIDPRFSAPGYWNKIGNWYNPTNVQGPFARLTYGLTKAVQIHLGGDYLSGARNRSFAVGAGGIVNSGMSMGTSLIRADAGVKWNLTRRLNLMADYEGVFWDLSGAVSATGARSKPVEQWITIGAGLNLTRNAVLKLAYQMINYQDVGGGFGSGAIAGGAFGNSLNGGVFTTQVAVHF